MFAMATAKQLFPARKGDPAAGVNTGGVAPFPSSTVTLPAAPVAGPKLATTMSILPSLLRSPTAAPSEKVPAGMRGWGVNPPLPLPRATTTPPAELPTTTRSRMLSWFRSTTETVRGFELMAMFTPAAYDGSGPND